MGIGTLAKMAEFHKSRKFLAKVSMNKGDWKTTTLTGVVKSTSDALKVLTLLTDVKDGLA